MSQSNKFIRLSAKSLLLSLGLTLVACGGGGGSADDSTVAYSGNTDQATIDETQAKEIAQELITADENNVGGSIAGGISMDQGEQLDSNSKDTLINKLKQDALNSINLANKNIISGISTSAVESGNCSIIGLPDGTATASLISYTNTEVKTKLIYSSLCIYDSVSNTYLVLNGEVNSTITGTNLLAQDGSGVAETISMSVQNLNVKYTNLTTSDSFSVTITEMYKFTMTYETDGSLKQVDFVGYTDLSANGKVYRFEIEIITTNTTSTTKLKFYHPTYGWVEYNDSLTRGCPDGSPDGGTLVITANNASYTITPSGSCDGTYTVVTN